MRCLILLQPFTQSRFMPLDFHRHVDKISMECTFCILPLAMKCQVTHLYICSIHHIIDAETEWAIEGSFE